MNTINTSGTPLTYESNNCGSRLPCGLCLITNSPCPFVVQTITPMWRVTCGGSVTVKTAEKKDYSNTTAWNGEGQT